MKTQFTIGAFAIIENENREVLLCFRDDLEVWNLPGGGADCGETPWDCVVREVKEETGLDVRMEKLLGVYSKTNNNDIAFLFKCRTVGGKLILSEEASALHYFSRDDLPEMLIPKQRERIEDYFSGIREPVLKEQTGISVREMLRQKEALSGE